MDIPISLASKLGSIDPLDWLLRRNCGGLNVDDFFVEAGHTLKPDIEELCRSCKARLECISHAYRTGCSAGYFGGLSPTQRRKWSLEESLLFAAADTEDLALKST